MFDSRKRLVVAVGVLTIGALGFAAPSAHAADVLSGSTPVTFTIAGGSLTVAVPSATVAIGNLSQSGLNYTGTAPLGTTTVTDNRGGLSNPLTITASSGGFKGGTTATVLPASDASLAAAVPTLTGGVVLAPTSLPVGSNMGSGEQILTGTTIGTGSATYTSTLTITVPLASAIADSYSGTVTQTAS